MEFDYLDKESEEILEELINRPELPKETIRGSAIEHLVKNDYINGKNVATLSDIGSCYLVLEITQKGKTYFG